MTDMQAHIKDLTLVAKEMGYTGKEALQYARDVDREMGLEERDRRGRD